MKRQTIPLAAIWSILAGLAACNASSADHAAAPATATERFTGDLEAAVYHLASDELEGRGVGTDGLDRAADYIADAFDSLGLEVFEGHEDYFQSFEMTLHATVSRQSRLAIGDRELALAEDFQPTSFTAEEQFVGDVVFVGYAVASEEFDYDDFAGVDVDGRIALAMRFEPHDESGASRFTGAGWSRHATILSKARAAAERGAVALLLVNPAGHHVDLGLMPFTRQMTGRRAEIPVIHVTGEVADELLQRGGADDLETLQGTIDGDARPRSIALGEAARVRGRVTIERAVHEVQNVMAYLPGEGRADEFVVIGAHYDHIGRGEIGSRGPRSDEIYNGADDNASGTAALLGLAARFAGRETPLDRSIIFVAFTAEEWGLIGSRHFVDNPPVELSSITSMVNFDMVGRIRRNRLYVGGYGTGEGFNRLIRQANAETHLRLTLIGRGGLGPSDHMSFAMREIPVLFFFSGLHEDYHRPTDTADKINYEGLEEVVNATAGIIEELATMPRPQYVEVTGRASPMGRAGAGGSRVALGVVPDYGTDQETGGVRISGTVPGSAAAEAGLLEGDVIVGFGDREIESLHDLTDALADARPGDEIGVQVLRDDERIEIRATLVERE